MPDIRTEIKRATALRYAWTFIGTPYRWGGDDPMAGFDCSGFVNEILTAVGIVPHKYDATAGGLAERFAANKIDKPRAGAFIVWYQNAKPIHVEMFIDEFHTIGASGGGCGTTDINAAIAGNAFVKIRPYTYRNQPFDIYDPFGGNT